MDSGNKVSPNTPEKAHDEASTPSKATARGTLYSAGISLIERAQAGELDPLVGRDEEVARIFRLLLRRQDPHVLLVGESGSGKTALVNGVALRLAEDPPHGFEGVDIIQVNHFFLAQSLPGVRWKQDIGNGKTILYVPDGLLNFSLSAALYDLVNRHGVRIISATTPAGMYNIKEQDPGLLRRFQAVAVKAPDEVETMKILRSSHKLYEQHHKVFIDDGALEMAWLLSEKYINDRVQPGAAMDLLDEACAMVALKREPALKKNKKEDVLKEIRESPVTAYEVLEIVADITGKTPEELDKELDESD